MARRVILDANGLRVSKSGKDAASTVFGDLLFDSSRVVSRAYMAGVVGANGNTQSVSHNLGYVPVFWISISTTAVGANYMGSNYNGARIYMTNSALVMNLTTGMVINYHIYYDQWK